MKDGYYLSTYLHIDEISNLLDRGDRHDQSIALFHKQKNNIELICYWELERFTGIKMHAKAFFDVQQAKDFINSLLEVYGLSLDDMVEIWGTPGLQTVEDYHSMVEYPSLSYHSISHLFSSLLSNTHTFYSEKIIGLAIDGVPDGVVDPEGRGKKCYYCGCYSVNGKVEMFPIYSMGLVWLAAHRKFKLREGTLMALASASNSRLYNCNEQIILINNRSTYFNGLDFFNRLVEKVNNLTDEDVGILFNGFDTRFTMEENKISMVMKEIQAMTIKVMESNLDAIIGKYNIVPQETFLSLAGGCALNCPINSYIMKKYKFKGFIASPCVSDSGLALGIGLFSFYKKMKRGFNFKLESAYYGIQDEVTEQNVKEYFKYIKSDEYIDCEKVVDDIIAGPIVWFDGRAEVGPRALGNRSILADPRDENSKKNLNNIKKREWWRPVAPVILEEDVAEWFEEAYSTPFMLHTFNIKKEREKYVPAIVHMDSSARIQTINNNDNEVLYKILCRFKEKTGIPLLCNTSLNDKGEPIINRIEEVFNFALRKRINVIYINQRRYELYNHEQYTIESPAKRPFSVVKFSDEEKEKIWEKYNPHNIPPEILLYCKKRADLDFLKTYDIQNSIAVKKLIKAVDIMKKFEKDNPDVMVMYNE